MSQWADQEWTRSLILAPRLHGKTSIFTGADLLRRIARNPDIRICILNESSENASTMMSVLRQIVEGNQIYQWLFPEIIPNFGKTIWNNSALLFKRNAVGMKEATVEAFGGAGSSVSRHYDFIEEDDLVGREARESPTVMEKAIEQHKLSEALLDNPNSTIRCVGTRWHAYDLVRWILEHQPNYVVRRLSVYRPDGVPIWPERFTTEYLQELRVQYGPELFALQFENRAVGGGLTEFDPRWLRNYRFEMNGKTGEEMVVLERPPAEGGQYRVRVKDMNRFQIVDAGLTPESIDARTANVVLGIPPPERGRPFDIVLLDAHAEKTAPKQTIEQAYITYRRWEPIFCSIEAVGGHVTFFWWLQTAYPDMAVKRLKTDTHTSKKARIRSFAPFCEQGRVYVNRTQVEWLEEYQAFPSGRTVDLLDATAYGPQVWFPPDPSGREGQWWRETGDEMPEEEYERYLEQQSRDPVTGY